MSFLDSHAKTDPTWGRAHSIVKTNLGISTHTWNLFRSCWTGGLSTQDLIHALGFARLNPASLIVAAGVSRNQGESDIDLLRRSIEMIGVPYSAVVLAINYSCAMVLRSLPPACWRSVFEEMMSNIEIGVKMGSRILSLSPAGGALIGFARDAGFALLMAQDGAGFKRWHNNRSGDPRADRESALKTFGTEPYQVSSFVIQQLGFGAELAIGAALATGRLNVEHISFGPEVVRWRAALEWIDALREGRSYPPEIEIRNFFPEIAPPVIQGRKNLVLDSLYAEVSKVKSGGSSWLWHLPRPSYEETALSIGAGWGDSGIKVIDLAKPY